MEIEGRRLKIQVLENAETAGVEPENPGRKNEN